MTALLDEGLLHGIAVDPPGRELTRVRAENQVRAALPEAGALDVGPGRAGRGCAVRVEDRQLVALVLEEPGLRRDLESEAVRRRLGVATALVADGLAVAQDDEPAGLVRRLFARMLCQLSANRLGNLQFVPPQNST
jgi:hypothetical protein